MTRRDGNRRGRMEMRIPLSTEPGEVPRVRQLVRATLHSWGLAGSEDVTLLLVSELVTNALHYGLPPLELRLSADGGRVRVEVFDAAGDHRPALQFAPLDAARGRGIEIVQALASRWGSAP
ncbi:MAG TPA: ATP-binding protein, partial [Jiangellaceae bacterium]|nr:ATP-binding protein [Jiangellaceae bacterium]